MEELFRNVLTASFHGSIVIAAVLVLRLLLKKTPKKFICLLWLMAGIRLLMPFEIRSDLSLQPELTQIPQTYAEETRETPRESQTAMMPAVPENAAMPEDVQVAAGDAFSPPAPEEIPEGYGEIYESLYETAEETPPVVIDWNVLFAWSWFLVACGFGVYSLISYLRLKRRVREAVKIPGGWECDRIETAFILGFLKPRIYIPMGMSPNVRRHILAHERTHLEKGDHWFKLVGFLALAIHWFNPLVWAAYILLCKDIEMACDERVVQFMELEERKEYSAALLSCSANRAHFAACPVAFGEVSVKERIKSVLHYKKPGFWISLVGVIAIAFVAVCLVTSPAEEAAGETVPVETEPTAPGEVSPYSTLAWAQTLRAEDVAFIDLDVGSNADKGYEHITDEKKIAEVVAFLNTCDGEFQESCDLPNSTSTSYNIAMKDGQLRCVVKYDGTTYFSVGRSTFAAEQSWLDSWPVEGAEPLPENYYEDLATWERIPTPEEEITDIRIYFGSTEPTESGEEVDPQLEKWGILFRMEDDVQTRYGGEIQFAKSGGSDILCTDNAYWLEKKTDSGWEKLPLLVENVQWQDANYVLGTSMYTMVSVDWRELYGPLNAGTYRMGKIFTNQSENQTCVGYAEFVIYHNESTTAQQDAAVEKCYAALEEVKARAYVHYRVTTSSQEVEEVWWNNENYLVQREWKTPIMPEDDDGSAGVEPVGYETRRGISARMDGIGYEVVHETKGDTASDIVGMQLSTLSANRAGWLLYSFEENLYLSFFERGNEVIDFPAEDSCISDERIRFHRYWSDPDDYTVTTFWFDGSGRITKMEYETHWKDMGGYTVTFEIYDTSAAEIDGKILPYTENLIVEPFSWEEAKAEYTDDKYNIREDSFVNTAPVSINGPVDAAKQALKEYPNLGDYLNVTVFYDGGEGMWKVTVEGYYDYQASYEYRDIYMDENGVTKLLVYEGPIGLNSRRES